jgi:hypothetical protein
MPDFFGGSQHKEIIPILTGLFVGQALSPANRLFHGF